MYPSIRRMMPVWKSILNPKELTMATSPDGLYQWMVPAGLWYVELQKEGCQPGSSSNYVAAVDFAGSYNWLPVLPAQLDVNIPLVSYDIPTVEVEYRADGVYQTFSKYMDETTLKQTGAFKIDSQNATVELLNSEPVPANINYAGEVSSYTSQMKLTTGGSLSGKVTVIIGNGVLSYTSVPCTTIIIICTGAILCL